MELYATLGAAAIVAGIATSCLWHMRRYSLGRQQTLKGNPPTVSLLIPARNETHAVTRALTNALALDYPKLEIIVLDDESSDNTSEKIRAFAQDGIRFIQGRSLPEGWIGKNWACYQLAEAASGDYLIFCDMDVTLSSVGLNKLMRHLYAQRLSGCSVMPTFVPDRLIDTALIPLLPWATHLLSKRWQHIRPAYGGLLIFRADTYEKTGGYQRFANYVLPEFRLAHEAAKYGTFRYILNSPKLQITLRKTRSSLDQARERYLREIYRLHGGFGTLHLMLVLLPLALPLINLWVYAVYLAAYGIFMHRHLNGWWLTLLLLPLTCLYELYLLLHSMQPHAKQTQTWKSRQLFNQ